MENDILRGGHSIPAIIKNVSSSIDNWPQKVQTVFLDRDGVINAKMTEGHYVCSENDLRVLPGVPEAIAKLNRAGILVVVVSNQRGVALGLYTSSAVNAIHENLQLQLRLYGAHIDAFYFCPHEKGSCNCRKPLPGLYQKAKANFPEISADTSVMIGDSPSDVEFGNHLGMFTIWIQEDPKKQEQASDVTGRIPNLRCQSLWEAVEALCAAL